MTIRPALVACALALALAGCGDGVTVQGRPPTTAPPPSSAPAPSHALRTPTPLPTPTEDRRTAPGPEATVRTPQGGMVVKAVTYSWQRTKFGEKSVPPTALYLVLDLEITALDGTPMLLPANFKAVQRGTQPQDPVFGRDGNQPVLASKPLQPAERVRGFVVYDLPQADTTVQILDELGAKVAELKIPAV